MPPENDDLGNLGIAGAMELVSQALGLGSLEADESMHEYLSEDAIFRKGVASFSLIFEFCCCLPSSNDERCASHSPFQMLDLALQLSLQDHGGPGTAALIAEEQESRASGQNAPLPANTPSRSSPSSTVVPRNNQPTIPLSAAGTAPNERQQAVLEEQRPSAVSGCSNPARPEGTNVSNAFEPSQASPSSAAERRSSTDAAAPSSIPPPPPPRSSQRTSLVEHP
ncbi:unnamed protein product [Dibothriocephalus latus]|uniref:Uncharacterized protein n=1 Tax=Dibothriocephalus latus TaxID=60516 RepID=A0A3P7M025_DIBLA|nr:unnamed protein product [Dibothriocephalus latus]